MADLNNTIVRGKLRVTEDINANGNITGSSITGNGSGLTNLNASNIGSGTLSADRLATSGATAGSYGPSANATPAYGATFNVPYITVDNKGRVTAASTKTVKIPASDNTDTKVTSVNNHYSPTADSGSELTATLSGTAGAYAKDTEYTVLTGVKAQRDAKGHVTGLTYTAQKVKDTNTTYTFNGAVSTIKDNNLTASRALISNSSGKVAVSDVTSTELSYLDGVTSSIQTQLNAKSDKTAYEWNKEFAAGSNGAISLGRYNIYDSQLTFDITSTTNQSLSGKLVIATQNGTIHQAKVFGDATGALVSKLIIYQSAISNSRSWVEVFCNFNGWSKNKVHIYAVALNSATVQKQMTSVTISNGVPAAANVTSGDAKWTGTIVNDFNHSHGNYVPYDNASKDIYLGSHGIYSGTRPSNGSATLMGNGYWIKPSSIRVYSKLTGGATPSEFSEITSSYISVSNEKIKLNTSGIVVRDVGTFTFDGNPGSVATSADLKNYVTTNTTQTISGVKTFSNSIILPPKNAIMLGTGADGKIYDNSSFYDKKLDGIVINDMTETDTDGYYCFRKDYHSKLTQYKTLTGFFGHANVLHKGGRVSNNNTKFVGFGEADGYPWFGFITYDRDYSDVADAQLVESYGITIRKGAVAGHSSAYIIDGGASTDKETRLVTEDELTGKANVGHGHAISDITNLQSTLNGKANASHTHTISQITNLQTTLDNKQNKIENPCSFTGSNGNYVKLTRAGTKNYYVEIEHGSVTYNGSTTQYPEINVTFPHNFNVESVNDKPTVIVSFAPTSNSTGTYEALKVINVTSTGFTVITRMSASISGGYFRINWIAIYTV